MKNQYLPFLFIFSFLLQNCGEPQPSEPEVSNVFSVSGKYYAPADSLQIFLSKFDPVSQKKTPLDTADVSPTTGEFKFKFELDAPELLRADFPNRKYVMLAVDKGQNNITLNMEGNSLDSVNVSGSADSEKILAYDQFRVESNSRLIKPTYAAMRAAGKTNENPAEEIKAVEAYVKASSEHRKELIDFTEKNIGTSIALFGTVLRWTGDDEVSRLDKLVSDFEAAHPDLPMTKVMREKVERYKKVAIGVAAPEIAENDRSGNLVALSEAKGKVTLIDFWASWCGPCLRQVPDLKEAYGLYNEKGFEIFGVSVDSKGEKWEASIDKYEMPWPNVSNLKGWGSEAAASYNVTFIPFNVLLDENGTIIAKNLHSKELQGKLAELLD